MNEKTYMQVVAMAGVITGNAQWKDYNQTGYAAFDVKNTVYITDYKRRVQCVFHVAYWGNSGKAVLKALKDGLLVSFDGKMEFRDDGTHLIHIHSVTLPDGQSDSTTMMQEIRSNTRMTKAIAEAIGIPTEAPQCFSGLNLLED